MDKYRVLEVSNIDKNNGFEEGQIVEGEIKKVKVPQPNERDVEILDAKDNESFLYSYQVQKI